MVSATVPCLYIFFRIQLNGVNCQVRSRYRKEVIAARNYVYSLAFACFFPRWTTAAAKSSPRTTHAEVVGHHSSCLACPRRRRKPPDGLPTYACRQGGGPRALRVGPVPPNRAHHVLFSSSRRLTNFSVRCQNN